MTEEERQDYQSVIDEIEDAFLNGKESKWDNVLVDLMPHNYYHQSFFERGHWLTRARHMTDPSIRKPYCSDEIGWVKSPSGEKKNRWGNMFYLSTDMTYKSAFNEVRIPEKLENGTLGYFYIKKELILLDVTEPRAVSNSRDSFGGVELRKALYALVFLINKWFNAPDDEDDDRVYKITNHVADLIRTRTELDGVVYKSTKNGNGKSWNVALKDDSKVEWGYSTLLVPDKLGRYRQISIQKSSIKTSDAGRRKSCRPGHGVRG